LEHNQWKGGVKHLWSKSRWGGIWNDSDYESEDGG